MSNRATYLKVLKTTYGELSAATAAEPENRRFLAAWEESLGELDLPTREVAALTAVQSMMPLVEQLETSTEEEFKESFARVFLSLVDCC